MTRFDGDPETIDVVRPTDLSIDPFRETARVRKFSSGRKDLDDFLNTDEVERYEKENAGKTFVVYHRHGGEPVGYYTISMDGLRREYWETTGPDFADTLWQDVEVIPAIKIGRLAVAERWQRKGIGHILLRIIAAHAKRLRRHVGLRLLILEAYPDVTKFYEKYGYEFVKQTKKELKRDKNTMFFDLDWFDRINPP